MVYLNNRLYLPYLITFISLSLLGCSADTPTQSWVQADHGLYSASLSEDGQIAVVASVDHFANVWDLRNNKLLYTWQHSDDLNHDIIHTAVAPNGKFAITAEPTVIAWWQTNTGNTLRYLATPAVIHSVSLSYTGKYAFVGLANNSALYIDLIKGNTIITANHQGTINSVALSADSRYAVTGSEDKTAKLWDLTTGDEQFVFQHDKRVSTVAISARSNYVFSSAGQFQASIWNAATGKLHHRLKLRGDLLNSIKPASMAITSAVFTKDERLLVTGSPSREIRLWDVKSGELLKTWRLPARTFWKPAGSIIYALAVSPDNLIISEGSDGMAYSYKLPSSL